MSGKVRPIIPQSPLDSSPSSTPDEEDEQEVYDIDFHYIQFLQALSIHLIHLLIGPLSIPLLWKVFGKALCSNMLYGPNRYYYLELQCHLPFSLAAIVYAFDEQRADDFRIVIIATMTSVLLRVLMVSLKYGTLSKKWWKRLKSKDLGLSGIVNTLLLHAWKDIPDDIAAEQLCMAFRRLPLDPETLYLVFQKPIESDVRSRLDNFRTPEAVEECPLDIVYEKSEKSYYLARLLLSDVVKKEKKTGLRVLFVIALGYTFTPHLIRLWTLGVETYAFDAMEVIYTPLSLWLNYYFPFSMLQFILVGVLDFRRKKLLMSQCSALISTHDRIYLLEKLPKLDLSNPRSVFGWYYMRRAFLDFGKRFSTRIHLYASVILPILIAAVIMLLLRMVGMIGDTYNVELLCPLYLTIAFDFIIIKMILAALELNTSFAVHTDLLLESISRLRDEETDAMSALLWTSRKLELDLALRPVKILGFTIDDGLVNQLLALGLSGGFALLQILLV